jgi:hypothetical protein
VQLNFYHSDTCIFIVNLLNYSVAPYIDRKNLGAKRMKSGEMLRLEVDVKGEPPPTITWAFKDVKLTTKDK